MNNKKPDSDKHRLIQEFQIFVEKEFKDICKKNNVDVERVQQKQRYEKVPRLGTGLKLRHIFLTMPTSNDSDDRDLSIKQLIEHFIKRRLKQGFFVRVTDRQIRDSNYTNGNNREPAFEREEKFIKHLCEIRFPYTDKYLKMPLVFDEYKLKMEPKMPLRMLKNGDKARVSRDIEKIVDVDDGDKPTLTEEPTCHQRQYSEKQLQVLRYCEEFFNNEKASVDEDACASKCVVRNVILDGPAGTGKTEIIFEMVARLKHVQILFLSMQHVLLNQVRTTMSSRFNGHTPVNFQIGTIASFVYRMFGCNLYQWNKVPMTIPNGITSKFEPCLKNVFDKFFLKGFLGGGPATETSMPFDDVVIEEDDCFLGMFDQDDAYIEMNKQNRIIIIDEFEMLPSCLMELIHAQFVKLKGSRKMLLSVGHTMQIGPIFNHYFNEGGQWIEYCRANIENTRFFNFSDRFRSRDSRLTEILNHWEQVEFKKSDREYHCQATLDRICSKFKKCGVRVSDDQEIEFSFRFDYLETDSAVKPLKTVDDLRKCKIDFPAGFFITNMPLVINQTNEDCYLNNMQMSLLYFASFYTKCELIKGVVGRGKKRKLSGEGDCNEKNEKNASLLVTLDVDNNQNINFNGWPPPTIEFKFLAVDGKLINSCAFNAILPILPGCPYLYIGQSQTWAAKNEVFYMVDYCLSKTSTETLDQDHLVMYSPDRRKMFKFRRVKYTANFLRNSNGRVKVAEFSFPFVLHHGCTAQSCVGLNIPENRKLFINTANLNLNEFYVACSRAKTLDQISGILSK